MPQSLSPPARDRLPLGLPLGLILRRRSLPMLLGLGLGSLGLVGLPRPLHAQTLPIQQGRSQSTWTSIQRLQPAQTLSQRPSQRLSQRPSKPSPAPLQAQGGRSVAFMPPPPPSFGRPRGSARGGAVRSTCPIISKDLIALVPSDPTATPPWAEGVTLTATPAFWFHVPQPLDLKQPGRFKLVKASGRNSQVIYETWVYTPPQQAGILSIPLPSNLGLDLDTTYQWSFQMYCDGSPIAGVNGSIRRNAAPAKVLSQLQNASPREQAIQLAAAGFWYDALTRVVGILTTQPNAQSLEDWRSLLNAVQLPDLQNRPFVPTTLQAVRTQN